MMQFKRGSIDRPHRPLSNSGHPVRSAIGVFTNDDFTHEHRFAHTGRTGIAIAQTTAPAVSGAPTAQAPAVPAAITPEVQPSANHNPAWVKYRASCKADIAKHYGEVERVKGERGKMRACLNSHQSDLSNECKAAIAEREAAEKAKKT